MRTILPSVTTIGIQGSSWVSKLLEVEAFGIRRFSLFVTGLSIEERKRCFQKLIEMKSRFDFQIPFVHAVSSMTNDEFLFLMQEMGTEYFNTHPSRQYPLEHKLSKEVMERLLVENSGPGCLSESDLEGFGGICFDLTHVQDAKVQDIAAYEQLIELSKKFPVHANHMSAFGLVKKGNTIQAKSKHYLDEVEEVNYLNETVPTMLGQFLAIELENSIAEQIQLKPLIEETIRGVETQSLEDIQDAA